MRFGSGRSTNLGRGHGKSPAKPRVTLSQWERWAGGAPDSWVIKKLANQTAEIGTLRALADRQRAELDQQKQLLAEQGARLQKLEALLAHQAEAPKAP